MRIQRILVQLALVAAMVAAPVSKRAPSTGPISQAQAREQDACSVMTRFPILKILFVPRQQERLGQGSPRNSRARGSVRARMTPAR